jgi:hypothetical protein
VGAVWAVVLVKRKALALGSRFGLCRVVV